MYGSQRQQGPPDDSPGEVDRETAEYLRAGTRLVLVVDPEQRTVTSSHPDEPASAFTTTLTWAW